MTATEVDEEGGPAEPVPAVEPDITGLRWAWMLFVPELLAMACALGILMVGNPETGMRYLAVASALYALYFVAARGGPYLTPSGVFFLASGVFVGLAAHYLVQAGSVNELHHLRDLSVLAFISTIATGLVVKSYTVHWRLRWPSQASVKRRARTALDANPPPHFQTRAVVLVVISQIGPLRSAAGPIASAAGLAGVMMLVLSGSARRVRLRWSGDLLVVGLAVVVPIIWIQLEFNGGGRLTLAGLGVASLLVWNLVRPRQFQKIAVVLSIPVFLLFAGLNRAGDDNAKSRNVVSSGDGLASVYSPLDTWAELPDHDRHDPGASVGPRWGRTFADSLVLPVPRALWPNKPRGFGSELTHILRWRDVQSKAIAPEHSMAALAQGEWYVNFGYTGLALMSFVLGWFLAVLDRSHLRLVHAGLSKPATWWAVTCLACLTASLGDLYWVGTFTFFARGGLAAIVAWVLWRLSTKPDRWSRLPVDAETTIGARRAAIAVPEPPRRTGPRRPPGAAS